MSAYLIARVTVTDMEAYDRYKLLTPAAVAASGGRFIARGGQHETLEGAGDDRRMVILEFPTYDDARNFYDSPAYVEARAVRAGAADMEITIVDGA